MTGPRTLLALLATIALAGPLRAQEPLAVETSLPADGWVDRDDRVVVRPGRALAEPGERLAIFFDHVDVTDLFRRIPDGYVYDPGAPPLPKGEGELVVWLVDDGGWTEIAREPLKVRGALGFERSEWDPGLDLAVEGQLAEGHDPDDNDPVRDPVFQDLSSQITLRSTHTRGDVSITGESTWIGTSRQEDALRFGREGDDAPKLDLSSYLLEYGQGDVTLSLGHVGFGSQRHLMNRFTSRGTMLRWAPGERVELGVSAMNGNDIVGWDNVTGLEEDDHKVFGAMLGVEALERPGALRVELTWMSASVLPRSGFNQGEINDAEESDGLAVSVSGSTPGGRLTVEGGISRSTYVNPFDPTLAQGDDLVEVEEETRNAQYLEASVDVLRSVGLGSGERTADLALAFRHERVDPEYQSIGAYARSDYMVNAVQLRGRIAGIDVTASHDRSEDNLDDVPSVLTTKTRQNGIDLGFPLARIFGVGGPDAAWLPSVRYAADRTHQFGEGIPENSGFSESHVPDQVSLNQTASFDWRWSRASFGWRLNVSSQDNRQPGREEADLDNRRHGFSFGVRPHDRVSIDLQLGLERRENHERDEVDETTRYGIRTRWDAFDRSSISLSWATTHSEDEAGIRERDDSTLDLQISSFLPYLDRIGGQWFVRFGRTANASVNREFETMTDRSSWNVDSGLNFSFF